MAGLVDLDDEAEALAHRGDGHLVDVVHGVDGVEPAEGLAREVRVVGVAVGREVVDLVVVPGDAEVRGLDRAGLQDGVHVGVGHRVDGGGPAGWVHPAGRTRRTVLARRSGRAGRAGRAVGPVGLVGLVAAAVGHAGDATRGMGPLRPNCVPGSDGRQSAVGGGAGTAPRHTLAPCSPW